MATLAGPVRAEDAAQRLEAALKKMDSLSAEFKQTLLDEDKNVVQQSRGTLALQRPGKFAWLYIEPFEQRIVGDGNELWVYDVELEQVTENALFVVGDLQHKGLTNTIVFMAPVQTALQLGLTAGNLSLKPRPVTQKF